MTPTEKLRYDRARARGRAARARAIMLNPYKAGTQCWLEWRVGRYGFTAPRKPDTRENRQAATLAGMAKALR